MDVEGKSAIIHTLCGVIFGTLSNYVYNLGLGIFSGIVTMIFLTAGLLIVGHITALILGKDSLDQKQWLGCGVTPYFFTAIVFWILAYNGVFSRIW
ncbi:MAG TPA: hypothetical protein EYG77_00030 [Methanothermococcus okinawensis]|nr:hypothetical protein [Methanothermococcus okinawensis]